MVSDQEEEDVKSDVFRLWVKLKIPKAEQEEEEKQGKKMMINIIGDDEKKKMSSSINIERKLRVCEICEKAFSSGKALGGHMRIHVQPNFKKETHKYFLLHNKKKKLKNKEEKTKKEINNDGPCGGNNNNNIKYYCYSCRMCGKEFPSMKSLSGHMRCHPDRDWRGIRPPPKHKHPSSSSSSSSYDHSSVVENDDDDDLDESNRAVDLAQSLRRGWLVTAKRGRTKSDDDHDHELLEAVSYLMMLARGESLDKSKEHEQKGLVANVNSKRKRKKMKLCDLNQNARTDNNSHRVLKFDLNHLPPSDGTDQATWDFASHR